MSARDDYPLLALHAADEYAVPGKRTEIIYALDEIDRLRRWKAEATQVIDEWDRVWDAAGRPGPLGETKAETVRRLLVEGS